MAKDDNDRIENKVFGDMDPAPGTAITSRKALARMTRTSRRRIRTNGAGSRDVTGGGGAGTETGGTRNYRQDLGGERRRRGESARSVQTEIGEAGLGSGLWALSLALEPEAQSQKPIQSSRPFILRSARRWRLSGARSGADAARVHPFRFPQLDLFGRRRRRKVFVQGPRLGLGYVPFGEAADDHALLPSKLPGDFYFVSYVQPAIRLRNLAVDSKLAEPARRLSIRARSEQARHVEPHVQPQLAGLADIVRCIGHRRGILLAVVAQVVRPAWCIYRGLTLKLRNRAPISVSLRGRLPSSIRWLGGA